MTYKYNQVLTSILSPCYNVVVGQNYTYNEIDYHFIIFEDKSSRLVRDEVIERHFKESK